MSEVFVIEDLHAGERNSHGGRLVVRKDDPQIVIWFYCDEYMWLWSKVEDIGKADLASRGYPGDLRPATFQEIKDANLVDSVNYVLFQDEKSNRRVDIQEYLLTNR